MMAFSACLVGSGAILSLVARLPVLLVLVGLALIAGLAFAALNPGPATTGHVLWITLVAVVAPQVGYGLGVALQALVRHALAQTRRARTSREGEEADCERSRAP